MNASEAGARLRTGVGTHTLSIGDHDVTLMIKGSRVELMRLTLAIADQAGLKISLDGHIDGNAAYVELYDEHMDPTPRCSGSVPGSPATRRVFLRRRCGSHERPHRLPCQKDHRQGG